MLAISELTLKTLEASARPLFARRVQIALAEKYLHFLPRFPDGIQTLIVGNMLGRASRWGINGQRALLAFCELMISVAANFDEQPEIRAELEQARGGRDATLLELPDRVSGEAGPMPSATRRPCLSTSDREWLNNPNSTGRRRQFPSCSMTGRKRHPRPPPRKRPRHSPHGFSFRASRIASSCWLPAAPVRADFDEGRTPWNAEIFGAGLPQRAIVNALRLRLALDFARFL